jgi:hypothetical protein
MRLLPTSNVPDGAMLARDILAGRDAVPLLRAGVKLDQRYRDALKRAGIHAVYIEDGLSEGIVLEPLVSDETRLQATRAVASAYEEAKRSLTSGGTLSKAMTESLSSIVERMLRDIHESGGAALVLAASSRDVTSGCTVWAWDCSCTTSASLRSRRRSCTSLGA